MGMKATSMSALLMRLIVQYEFCVRQEHRLNCFYPPPHSLQLHDKDMDMIKEKTLDLYGTRYKIGRFGLAFIWLNDAWTRSAKSADELYRLIDKQGAE